MFKVYAEGGSGARTAAAPAQRGGRIRNALRNLVNRFRRGNGSAGTGGRTRG